MSRKYKFHDPEAVYFISFAAVNWIDVFTRRIYKDIVVESINYCIENKGLIAYAWVLMSNHVHLIIESSDEPLQNIMRDLKKHTSKEIIKAIEENPRESRKEWMLWIMERAGKKNPNNKKYQFWQQHNQPLLLSNTYAFEQKLNYLHENPIKAGWVESEEEYLYSSAKDYSEQKGLVKVVVAR